MADLGSGDVRTLTLLERCWGPCTKPYGPKVNGTEYRVTVKRKQKFVSSATRSTSGPFPPPPPPLPLPSLLEQAQGGSYIRPGCPTPWTTPSPTRTRPVLFDSTCRRQPSRRRLRQPISRGAPGYYGKCARGRLGSRRGGGGGAGRNQCRRVERQ